MRHARFAVTPRMRDLWLGHMRTAIEQADLTPAQAATFWEYVERAAHFLVNAADDDGFAREAKSHVGLTVTSRDPLEES
jgi:hemoglobin